MKNIYSLSLIRFLLKMAAFFSVGMCFANWHIWPWYFWVPLGAVGVALIDAVSAFDRYAEGQRFIEKTPYQKIVLAHALGIGVMLTAEETRILSVDHAIHSVAKADSVYEKSAGKLPNSENPS